MRKLVMWNLQTLDGYFEGTEPWSLDFHDTVWGPELEQMSIGQEDEVGTLLFGRATYEGMAKYWSTATGHIAEFMNGVPKVVFSDTLDEATWNNTRLMRGDAADAVAALKNEDGKDLFVFGSAALCDSLRRRGLFDEYRVCLAPILLGRGVPLFKPSDDRRRLRLAESRQLATGGVILRYLPFESGPDGN